MLVLIGRETRRRRADQTTSLSALAVHLFMLLSFFFHIRLTVVPPDAMHASHCLCPSPGTRLY